MVGAHCLPDMQEAVCLERDKNVRLSLSTSGLASTSLLKWSPDGSYLLAALPRGGFQLWETCNWGNIAFQAGAGQLVSACWSPDSKTLLLAFSGARQLTAVYLIGRAYSLKAQLLPVTLPAFDSGAGSTGRAYKLSKNFRTDSII